MNTNNRKRTRPITERFKAFQSDGPLSQRINSLDTPHAPENAFINEKIHVEMACTDKELRKCYQLIYEQYVSYGYTDVHSDRMRINLWNCLPNTFTLMAKEDNRLTGTVSFIMDSDAGLPMDDIAENRITTLRKQNRRLCEVSGLAVDRNYSDATTIMALFRYGIKLMAQFLDTTDFLITVNPKHEHFYKRVLLFEQIGPVCQYDKVKNAPGIPMQLDILPAIERLIIKAQSNQRAADLYNALFIINHDALIRTIQHDLNKRRMMLTMDTLNKLFCKQTGVLRKPEHYALFCKLWLPYWMKAQARRSKTA